MQVEVKKALDEAVASMYRIQGEKDQLKAIADRMKEEYAYEKRTWNKMVKFSYEQSLDDALQELEEIKELLE